MSRPLFNKSALKRLFTERAKALRPAWSPNRVSDESLAKAEAHLRNWVDAQIMQQPSKGKTIKI